MFIIKIQINYIVNSKQNSSNTINLIDKHMEYQLLLNLKRFFYLKNYLTVESYLL